MLLDTTFLIDLMRSDKGANEKLSELIDRKESVLISSLSIFELYSGFARSKSKKLEKEKIIGILNSQIKIPLDSSSAEIAGIIDGDLISKGKTIGVIDSMIGGCAIINKQKVLTRNIKDFSKIPNLEIENY